MEREIQIENKVCKQPQLFGVSIVRDGVEIGYAYGQLNPGDEKIVDLWEILVVDNNNRRKGYGSALFIAFVNKAKERGANQLVAEVYAFNGTTDNEAKEFYAKNGVFVNAGNKARMDLTSVNPSEE